MLPRRLRLTRHTFPKDRGQHRAASPSFSAVWGPSRKGGCAAVVGKGVARRSVARHLLKRRMLSVMQPFYRSDRYLVVYARSSATSLSYRDLVAELAGLLGRIGR